MRRRSGLSRLAIGVVVSVAVVWLPGGVAKATAGSAAGYAWGDFNGDGFADVAIGVPGESIGSKLRSGAVNVIYGGESGLDTANDQVWHQSSPGVPGTAESNDAFGAALAVGDFDGEGHDDLAIGVPGEGVGSAKEAGSVTILFGTDDGLGTNKAEQLYQGLAGITGTIEGSDHFGSALTAGDYDGDGYSDVAVGVPNEDTGPSADAGVVQVLYGDPITGVSGARNLTVDENTEGVPGSIEPGDRFGSSLTSGDFDDNGTSDLAIGVPFESVGSKTEEGIAYAIRGDTGGLDVNTTHLFDQDTIFQTKEGHPGEHFGFSLAAGDFDPDTTSPKHYDDLAIGVPGDLPNASGAVSIVEGSENGFVASGDKWYQGKPGEEAGAVAGIRETGDEFGSAVVAGDFNGDGASDLAIGVRGEDLDTRANAGAVEVLYSDGSGLNTTVGPNQLWTQGPHDAGGVAETGDALGTVVGAGDFDNDGADDLIGCAPGEDVKTIRDAGAFNALYKGPGDGDPLGQDRRQLWTQDTPGIGGVAETNDRFGGATA